MAKKFATIENVDLLETLIRSLFEAYKIKLHDVKMSEVKGALIVYIEGDFWYKNRNQTSWGITFRCKRTSYERLQYEAPEVDLPGVRNAVMHCKDASALNNALQDRYTEVLEFAKEQAAVNMMIHEHGRIVMRVMTNLATKLGENYLDTKEK